MKQPDGLQLQDRDLALLRGLFESRVMSTAHVAALYFEGRPEAAKKRLQKLTAAGLILARRNTVSQPAVLSLTRKAFGVLRERGVLTDYPELAASALDKRARVSERTLQHELEVMDVKVGIHVALTESSQFSLIDFKTWPLLYQFHAIRPGHLSEEVLVQPDGFLRIHEQEADGGVSEHTFFLEVDRSNETLDTLVAKAGCYVDFYKSGGFAMRQGAPATAYKDYPFRVLMVFKTAERRNNVAERLLQQSPPILTQTMLTTLVEVTAQPLEAIWMLPQDYREATQGTEFDPDERRHSWVYARQTERERLVAAKAKLRRLLADAV